jgi:hypothetical protein
MLSAWCLFAVLLLFFPSSMTAQVQAPASELELTVVTSAAEPGVGGRTVWLGIRNRTRSPRLVCVLSRAIWPKVSFGPNQMEGFSPHGCQAEEAYTIVLANETAYVAWTLPRTIKVTPDQALVVKADVASKGLPVGERRTMTLLEWNGTASDMIDAAKALTKE